MLSISKCPKNRYLSLPFLAALAIGNEVLDTLYYSQKELQVNWPESLSDIFNTIFLPTLMLVFLRFKSRKVKSKNYPVKYPEPLNIEAL